MEVFKSPVHVQGSQIKVKVKFIGQSECLSEIEKRSEMNL